MNTVNYTPNRQRFLDLVSRELPGVTAISRKQVVALVEANSIKWPSWLTGDKSLRSARGEFILPTLVRASRTVDAPAETAVSTR